jgi:hypothetical protein
MDQNNQQNNRAEEIRLLSEILKWVRFAGIKEVKEALISELDTDKKKVVYHLSDGNHTLSEIVKMSGASAGAISGYWKKWTNLGFGEKLSVQGGDRFVKSFDLGDFSISIPELKLEEKQTAEIKEKT